MDLTNDESAKTFGQPTRSKMRWDAKGKKYVSRENDEDGSKGGKLIMGESGVKIAASFQSGRFDKWKREQRMGRLPRVGEAEKGGNQSTGASSGPRYKHKQERAPKEADKWTATEGGSDPGVYTSPCLCFGFHFLIKCTESEIGALQVWLRGTLRTCSRKRLTRKVVMCRLMQPSFLQ